MIYDERQLLQSIREMLSVDFVSIANVLEYNRNLLAYSCASGNQNQHFKKIVLEKGHGIIGRAYQEERSIVFLLTEEDRKNPIMAHYPIILAENLKDVMAIPLWRNEHIQAVLVLGYRTNGRITEEFSLNVLGLLKKTFREYSIREEFYENMVTRRLEVDFQPVPIYELMNTPIAAARMEERKMIAMDLHDNVLQNVVGVKWLLNSVRQASGDRLEESVMEIEDYLDMIQKELRSFTGMLRTTLDEEKSLCSLMDDQIRMMRKFSDMDISFLQNIGERGFGKEVELSVLRISQEAIFNAFKYSKAGQIKVSLLYSGGIPTSESMTGSGGILTLMVEDQGVGFEMDKIEEQGEKYGFKDMEEWANMIRGTLMIDSKPGKGTKVCLLCRIS